MKNLGNYIGRKEFKSIEDLINDSNINDCRFIAEQSSDGVNEVATIKFPSGEIAGKIYRTFYEDMTPVFYAGWYEIN